MVNEVQDSESPDTGDASVCPNCGGPGARIRWGYSTTADAETARHQGDVLGGDVIDVDPDGRVAVFECRNCHTRFTESGEGLRRTECGDPPPHAFSVEADAAGREALRTGSPAPAAAVRRADAADVRVQPGDDAVRPSDEEHIEDAEAEGWPLFEEQQEWHQHRESDWDCASPKSRPRSALPADGVEGSERSDETRAE